MSHTEMADLEAGQTIRLFLETGSWKDSPFVSPQVTRDSPFVSSQVTQDSLAVDVSCVYEVHGFLDDDQKIPASLLVLRYRLSSTTQQRCTKFRSCLTFRADADTPVPPNQEPWVTDCVYPGMGTNAFYELSDSTSKESAEPPLAKLAAPAPSPPELSPPELLAALEKMNREQWTRKHIYTIRATLSEEDPGRLNRDNQIRWVAWQENEGKFGIDEIQVAMVVCRHKGYDLRVTMEFEADVDFRSTVRMSRALISSKVTCLFKVYDGTESGSQEPKLKDTKVPAGVDRNRLRKLETERHIFQALVWRQVVEAQARPKYYIGEALVSPRSSVTVNPQNPISLPLQSSGGQLEHDPTETREEGEVERRQMTASELPNPEATEEWKRLSSYLRETAGVVEEPVGSASTPVANETPPHIWVINQHVEDVTVVVSGRESVRVVGDGEPGFGTVMFRSPATKKVLSAHALDSERSSAAFPIWTADDGCGFICILVSGKQELYLETRRVPAGAWVYVNDGLNVNVLEREENSSKRAPVFPITINGNTLGLKTEADLDHNPQSSYILIQSWMPLTPQQKKQLRSMSLSLHRYVSKNTYLCHRKETSLDEIRRPHYVAYADIYRQGYKISASLSRVARGLQSHSRILHEVDIIFHDDVNPKKLRKYVAEMANLREDTLTSSKHKFRQAIREKYLGRIASIDEVRAVEKVYKLETRSNIARVILRADVGGNPGAGPDHTYDGEGEVVAVADTGFDRGHIRKVHHAFLRWDPIPERETSRVLSIYPLSHTPLVNDFDGHGTHVCALAVGSGQTDDGLEIRGTAPGAKLVVQCLGPTLDGIPDDLEDLFEVPYHNNGARVHTNSWGATYRGVQFRYEAGNSAAEIDKFVWHNPDLVICFAAGNDGDYDDTAAQIGAEAAAKNCITVGATINDEQDADELAEFSSRGPTVERRIKPDVVAPGECLLSANSAHKGHPEDPYHPDPKWCYIGGTSQAAPLVAGCAAVLRQALLREAAQNEVALEGAGLNDIQRREAIVNKIRDKIKARFPSAALVKALLINGAVLLPPNQHLHNDDSGFGRVDLACSLAIARGVGNSGFEERNIVSEDLPPPEIPVTIPDHDGRLTLKVTLVWSDREGTHLQSDLDLVVTASDGTNQHGNIGVPDGPDHFDRRNNVEQVEWAGIPAGTATIVIKAHRLYEPPLPGPEEFIDPEAPDDPVGQPFACTWRLFHP